MQPTYDFDIAISYASEQRSEARQLALILDTLEIKIYFDEFNQADAWGKDLAEYLAEIYYNKARFCVMFISRAYAAKMWPTHERRHALARALAEKGEYILPIKFDDTVLPGLAPTIAYIPWSNAESLAAAILAKLEKAGSPDISVPTLQEDFSLDAVLRSVRGINRYASFNIMVIGKAGVGKSSLINNLFGKQVRPVGVGRAQTPMGFHKDEIIMRGVPVTIYDSGGLEVSNIEIWRRLLQKELDERNDTTPAENWIHTVLYCISAGSERIDSFEVDIIRQLVEQKQRVIIVFTKADQTGRVQLEVMQQTILIDVGAHLSCVNVCNQEREIVVGMTIPKFGLDEVQAQIVSGFWESIKLRLPHRCVVLLQGVIDLWGEKQKTWIRQNVGYTNRNKSEAYLNGQVERFRVEFTKEIMPTRITEEVTYTLNMFGSISRMFGLSVSRVPSRLLLEDTSNLLAEAQEKLMSGLQEMFLNILVASGLLVPIPLLFRGSINRSELETYIDTITTGLKERVNKSEPAISDLITTLINSN